MSSQRIGKYEILAEIGRGSAGCVYRANDTSLPRLVALKVLSVETGQTAAALERFRNEARTAAQLNHPNIVTLYEFGAEHGCFYLAMELLEGADLRVAMVQGSIQTLTERLRIMDLVCAGLGYAHGRGVVHRDLKPANVFLQRDGQVKLLDFGLARIGDADKTREGLILGTPHYMSPEQVHAQKADARSDIFSLGAVFYELLTNRKPFEGHTLHALLHAVLNREPESISRCRPSIARELEAIIERAMQKDPSERFQTVEALRVALFAIGAQGAALADDFPESSPEEQVPFENTMEQRSLTDVRPPAPAPARELPQNDALSLDDFRALVDTGRELAGELALGALLQLILERATALTDSADSSVLLHDEARDRLYFAHATGVHAGMLIKRWGQSSEQGVPITGSKAGQVFSSGFPLIVDAVQEDAHHFKGIDRETGTETSSMICVPINVLGKRLGVVQLLNKRVGSYSRRDLVLLEYFRGPGRGGN